MRKIALLLLCALLLTGCAAPLAQDAREAYAFTDDTRMQLQVPCKPGTVAVLTSSLADLWITSGGQVDITVYESVERGIT